MFVIVEGIDGCGKGTVVASIAEHERQRGRRVFDLRAFAARERRLPEPEELTEVDCIVSAEPTHAWVGAAIREEVVRSNARDYDARHTAELFALDRLILYRRVLLPARERGVDIIQERSVASSLVYQQHQQHALALAEIAALPGNAFCLVHPPDCCIIVTAAPERAMERLAARTEKRDAAIFERLPVLGRLDAGYSDPAFHALLKRNGWNTITLDADRTVEHTRAAARDAWERTRVPATA